jgi:aminoglycoside phosphotransferase (APT) family kinase protein
MLAMQPHELQKIAEGREAEMFAWEEGTILRLLRDPEAGQLNEWQAVAIESARSLGVRVPAVHSLTTVGGRPGMVMERIDGPDLLALIARRPWKMFWGARILGEVQAQLHAASASSGLPGLNATLKHRIESYDRLPEHLRRFALRALDELPDGDSLCHGDFHPGNILMAGETPVVIDWTNATQGDPDADVARTLLMFRIGELPPGSPMPLRVLAMFVRRVMASAYLRAYRRQRPLEPAAMRRWDIPVAAARVADGIEEELPKLLAILEEEYGGTG